MDNRNVEHEADSDAQRQLPRMPRDTGSNADPHANAIGPRRSRLCIHPPSLLLIEHAIHLPSTV